MKTLHTPGEWKVDRSGDVVSPTGKIIAIIPLLKPGNINLEAAHERTANIRLIAGAPELLESLTLLLAEHRALRREMFKESPSPVEIAAHNAVHNATP